MRRRCGWLNVEEDPTDKPIWGRRGVVVQRCPKSFITEESQALVEEFLVRRRLDAMDFANLGARQVEAFAILEKELQRERGNGQQDARRNP
jgi:hypothetical protein